MHKQADASSVPPPDREPPPPFDPDLDLIDHAEGNAWSRRGYRRAAERLRQAVQA